MTVFVTAGKARTVSTIRLDPRAVLPLHAELYLLAHDDDTGTLLINEQALALGLAGALLLELSHKGHVAIGYIYHSARRQWQTQPGRLTVYRPGPTANPPLDAALAAVTRTVREDRSDDQLRTWLRSFATPDLYERVRAALIAVGLIQRTERRRLGGLVRTETHLPVHYGYAVRARAHIRDAVTHHRQPRRNRHAAPDDECAALCGLIAALELAEFLYDGSLSTTELIQQLWHIVTTHENPAIAAVVQAVDAGRGDLAVAAMR
ncbi:GOLPH3/VPS74 family protein [Jidongwangia harbinensis]|uniref:GOLPH3/VPS74 family protein n=1 Tax=Jidongwangia harbinensis TaxID=2878561 RepID=UPI001CD9DF64|nr:GPP34 family phosphoprotein [Jidongwangia harbinensis]MCA2216289.1 GPP34 family phosphoprotein [Jidongwangia harbinensis]MCA2217024.1 GPP34 family phosphoprotein [Jidongwangia harbinensis]